jgi:hypothetical protein
VGVGHYGGEEVRVVVVFGDGEGEEVVYRRISMMMGESG